MAYEEKEGFGTLFPNSYKEKDTQPDFKGKIMINDEIVKLSGWNKEYGSEGKIRISLAVDTFEPKKHDPFAQAHNAIDDHKTNDITDRSDLPF